MCGLTGVWAPGAEESTLHTWVVTMTAALAHRGPDDAGVFVAADAGVALGHRRLSILDTSERGHQPMTSSSRRFTLVYNGEVYNYAELRAELESAGVRFRTGTDTEVLVEAIEAWGLERTLRRAVGMFAFAAFDAERRELHLARDRIGQKPLYWGRVGQSFCFSSELHAIRAAFGSSLRPNIDAFGLLARFGFIPEPLSALQGIKKLTPGTFVTLRESASGEVVADPERAYWSMSQAVSAGLGEPLPDDPGQVVQAVGAALTESVRLRMRSDVPLGAFLSGGIDSSLVVALMRQFTDQPVRTFSIGFDDQEYDEAPYAAAVARHLGTRHREFRLVADDAIGLVEHLSQLYDEPFADSSQLPTLLVSRLAREDVTVALTGDGGDEFFAGYDRHVWAHRLWRRLGSLPQPVRVAVARGAGAIPAEWWTSGFAQLNQVLPPALRLRRAGDKVQKLSRVLGARDQRESQLSLATFWDPHLGVVPDASATALPIDAPPPCLGGEDPVHFALWFDSVLGLPGDMLVKVDRASMAAGLEARQPFLDHRLVELSWRVPLGFKIRGGVGKWVLRELLAQHVPRALFERPKMGFGIPLGAWLRGPLRPWAEDLLSFSSLQREGVFEGTSVRNAWEEHQRGASHEARLWAVLMGQQWLRSFRDRPEGRPLDTPTATVKPF